MDVKRLITAHFAKAESFHKENFLDIDTIRFEGAIEAATRDIQEKLGLVYLSTCLTLPNGLRQVISNNPGKIAIPYQVYGLHKIDSCFDPTCYKNLNNKFFDPRKQRFDDLGLQFVRLLADQFHVINQIGFVRQFEGLLLIVIAGKKRQASDIAMTQTLKIDLVMFAKAFFSQLLPLYAEKTSALKYSRFFQDDFFRNYFIEGRYTDYYPKLSARELQCLYWVRMGKSTDEIAAILNLKRPTIRNYLEKVREKFHVGSIQEAVMLAYQRRLIS